MTIAETGIIIDIVVYRMNSACAKPRRKEETMSNIPSPGQIYRHFKGNLYRIVTLAEDSETGNMLVIYQALYGKYKVYARPLSMFMERLDKRKYPDAGAEFRFELQKELIEAFAVPEPVEAETEFAENIPETETYAERIREQEPVTPKEDVQPEEEMNIDPLVLEFLDARTCEERLRILSQLRPRITDSMINVMSIAADVEIKDGDTEERFDELRACLSTRQRYESRSSRLR